MNSKEVPPASSTNVRRSRRNNNNNNDAAAPVDTARINNRDVVNMFADLRLSIDRLEVSTHRSPIPSVSNQTIRDDIPEATDLPTLRTPRYEYGEMREPRWADVANMTPPTTDIGRLSFAPNLNPVEGADIDDDASFGSLPALVQRDDSSDDDSSDEDSDSSDDDSDSSDEDSDSSDDEENEVMTYGSLPSLVTRSDSSSDDEDEDDCSLPSLVSHSPSGEGNSLLPLLGLGRETHHTLDNVGRLYGDIRGIPLLLQRRHLLLRRRDGSDSDNDSDGDDSNYSSDDSTESDGETYWEAVELEMETSNNHFDNEAIIDNNDSVISSSQRRVNRFSGSSTVRRNLSRVRCRCLARVSNTQAWIALRDNMRVRRAVQ